MPKRKQLNREPIIFTDFDGTISCEDVGNRLFHHFSDGRSDEVVAHWYMGEIDSRQCLIKERDSLRNVSRKELLDFFDEFIIDPDFSAFVDFCRDQDWPVYILSDGLDIYINRILEKYGLDDLPVIANWGKLVGGRMELTFPYYEYSCGVCANCKGYQIRRLRVPGRSAVYIGDGKSDLCALSEADIVFAKGYLADHCRDNDFAFTPFSGFNDVLKKLRSIYITAR